MEDEQAGVNQPREVRRYVGDHVDGLVDAGAGVEVLAELDAAALQVLTEHHSRKVGGAVEGHVLQEVGETALALIVS